MAEFVNEMQERMLPEYEKMKTHQILSDEAIKQCIAKREDFLYKITRPHKSPQHFLEYIIYERKMHKLIEDKEIELNIKLSGLKASISSRIIRLYRDVLKKFPHDIHLWENFLKFSKRSNPTEVAGIYEKMLSFHADKPNIWCEAATWTYETTQDIKRATAIYLRGLNRHQDSERIFMSFLQVMLNETLKMSDERILNNNTESEQDIGLASVLNVYQSARTHIKNPDFFLKLLTKCEDPQLVNVTASLQYTIIKDLKDSAPRHENLWEALAQRELKSLSLIDIMKFCFEKETGNIETNAVMKPFVWKTYSLEKRIKQCCRVYETAVSAVNTSQMWSLYINAMLLLNTDMSEEAILKRKCLAKAFKSGHNSHKMSVEHYIAFFDLMNKTIEGPSIAAKIIREAVQYRAHPELFERLMEVSIENNEEEHIEEILADATNRLGEQSLSLWLRVISHYNEIPEAHKKVEELYRESCHYHYDTFVELRCNYLQYAMQHGGIRNARKAFAELSNIPPYKKELFKQMIDLDLSVAEHMPEAIKHCRECFERMTLMFGKNEPSIWIDFLNFEKKYGKPEIISSLYDRAKHELSTEYVDEFVSSYALEMCKTE